MENPNNTIKTNDVVIVNDVSKKPKYSQLIPSTDGMTRVVKVLFRNKQNWNQQVHPLFHRNLRRKSLGKKSRKIRRRILEYNTSRRDQKGKKA